MATVKEIIDQLTPLDPNMTVYVIADHGQTLIKCSTVSVEHVVEESYYAENAWNEEGDEMDESAPKVCVIGD